jgi:SAM-dependent methyltransferase
MLKVAKVGKNDILYDLGSGDGRVVITAAKRFGTRGVGVDIDPARIREARENAVKAGVAEKVKFLQQDLFKTDIHEATVVTLFLLPEVNLRLRPKLLSDLKPGTRVVSHNFGMGDWTQTPVRKNGLLLGSTAPEFELPDLSGTRRGLSDFRSRPVLQIFFSPSLRFLYQDCEAQVG